MVAFFYDQRDISKVFYFCDLKYCQVFIVTYYISNRRGNSFFRFFIFKYIQRDNFGFQSNEVFLGAIYQLINKFN